MNINEHHHHRHGTQPQPNLSEFIKAYLELNRIDFLELNGVFSSHPTQDQVTSTTSTTTSTTSTEKPLLERQSRASKKKNIPKVSQFVPLSRDFIHQFSKSDKLYKNSLVYAYSQPEIIDSLYQQDEDFFKDQSETSKLVYLSETIAQYRQLFGYCQNEPMRLRGELVNNEIKKLKNNILKTTSTTSLSLPINNYNNNNNNNIINNKDQDMAGYYYLKNGIVEKGYLSILSRWTLFKNNTFAENIGLHHPFTDTEKIILRNSNVKVNSNLSLIRTVIRELPGRTPIDVVRFLKDEGIIKKDSNFKKLDILLRNHEKEKNLFIKDLVFNKDVEQEFQISSTDYSDKKDEVLDVNNILLMNELGISKSNNEQVIKNNQRKIIKNFTKGFRKISYLGNGGGNVLDCKFDPTGCSNKILSLSKGNNNSILYDYKQQSTQHLKFHEKQCNEGHFSAEGSRVITCSKDGRIASWSTDTSDLLGYYEHDNGSPCLRLTLHKTYELAAGGFNDKSIVLYNYGTHSYTNINAAQTLDLWPCPVTDLSFGFGKNSDYIAGGIGSITDEAVKGFVTIIDINRPDQYLNLFVQEKDVSSIAWNPKLHDCLASASNDPDRSICIYDLRNVEPCALTMKTGQEDVNICCYSPCGSFISISGTTNCTYVFDTRNCEKPICEFRHKINDNHHASNNSKLVNHAQWSKNGEYIGTAADDGTVRLWDVENNKQLISLEHAPFPGTSINYFDISLNSDLIVSGGDDGFISIFGLNQNDDY